MQTGHDIKQEGNHHATGLSLRAKITMSISEICHRHNMSYHCYTDNLSNPYITGKISDSDLKPAFQI